MYAIRFLDLQSMDTLFRIEKLSLILSSLTLLIIQVQHKNFKIQNHLIFLKTSKKDHFHQLLTKNQLNLKVSF